MTKERLQQFKTEVEYRKQQADKILAGDSDNYDGADGARYIRDLCKKCNELIAELEKLCGS